MAQTVEDFLVSLGFRVDASSEQKFKNSIDGAIKGTAALAVSLTAAATAVSAAVSKIAAGFDEMFYMSQRAGASVQNIKGLSYAVSQLGGSYQGALASIESFSRKLRSNPGYESLVKQLGVATRENGKLRETTAIVQDLSRALSSKPYYIQLQYMEALGLDERTYRALQSGELKRYIEEYAAKARALGVDQKQAAEIGQQLTQAWRSLGATAELIGAKLEQTLGRSMASFVKDIDDFLIRNADKIVRFFDEAGKAAAWLAAAFQKLVEALTPAWEAFDRIAVSLTGQSGLQVALEAFAVWLVGSWLLRILGAFTAVGAGWGAMLLKLGINPLTLGVAGALALSTSPANGGEDQEIARRRRDGTWGSNMTGAPGSSAAPPQITDKRNIWQRHAPKWLGGQDGPAAPSNGISRYGSGGRRSRLTPEQAGEMRQGIEQSAKDLGISAEDLATVISYETGGTMHPWQKGPTTKWGQHRGLIQWGEPQRRKYGVNENSSIADQMKAVTRYLRDAGVRPGHGILDVYSAINAGSVGRYNASDAAAGGAPGTVADKVQTMGAHRAALAKLGRLAASGGGYVPPYNAFSGLNAGSLAAAQSNAALIGGGIQPGGGAPLMPPANSNSTNVEMNHKTDITILGGSDPGATASAVADAQNGVMGKSLRNMQGAVR